MTDWYARLRCAELRLPVGSFMSVSLPALRHIWRVGHHRFKREASRAMLHRQALPLPCHSATQPITDGRAAIAAMAAWLGCRQLPGRCYRNRIPHACSWQHEHGGAGQPAAQRSAELADATGRLPALDRQSAQACAWQVLSYSVQKALHITYSVAGAAGGACVAARALHRPQPSWLTDGIPTPHTNLRAKVR